MTQAWVIVETTPVIVGGRHLTQYGDIRAVFATHDEADAYVRQKTVSDATALDVVGPVPVGLGAFG